MTARRMRLENKYSWSKFAACITSLYEDILHNPCVLGETPVEFKPMKDNVAAGLMRPDIES
jgi:hypothetical protein